MHKWEYTWVSMICLGCRTLFLWTEHHFTVILFGCILFFFSNWCNVECYKAYIHANIKKKYNTNNRTYILLTKILKIKSYLWDDPYQSLNGLLDSITVIFKKVPSSYVEPKLTTHKNTESAKKLKDSTNMVYNLYSQNPIWKCLKNAKV